jgi:AcrR family transcriptional regulator
LLDAAGRLVEKGGASSLSMRALAAETRTSPMSAYELFGSKDGLLIALLKDRQRAFARRLATEAKGSGLDRFFHMIELSGPGISENFNFFQAASFQYYSPAGKEIREVFTAERRNVIQSLLTQVEFDRLTDKMTIDALADHINNVYNGALFDWMVGDGDETRFVRQFGLGCALALKAVSHPRFRDYLDEKIGRYSS